MFRCCFRPGHWPLFRLDPVRVDQRRDAVRNRRGQGDAVPAYGAEGTVRNQARGLFITFGARAEIDVIIAVDGADFGQQTGVGARCRREQRP